MPALDYAAWVARAHAFSERLKGLADARVRSTVVVAPASEHDLADIERALETTLPAPLRAFFTQGAAALDGGYSVEPTGEASNRLLELLPGEARIFGGARLGPLSDLPQLSVAVIAWARDTWVAEEDAQRLIWESARPFLALDNGDYLALDLRAEVEPPVVYLNHDDESMTIAPSFDRFLQAWEGLCYLGPEHWLLRPFVDADGYVDGSGSNAARLRRMLTP